MYASRLPPAATQGGLDRVQGRWTGLTLYSISHSSLVTYITEGRPKRGVGITYTARNLGQWLKRRRFAGHRVVDVSATSIESEEVPVGELKAQLLDSLFGIERGLSASSEVRAEIIDLITQLEAKNPTPSPNEELDVLDGTWKLVYTANSELIPLLGLCKLPLVTVGDILQKVDSKQLTVENKVFLSSPFSQTSFSTTATVEIQSPKRLEISFREGRVAVPHLTQDLEIPNSISVLGQPVILTNLKDALEPVNARVKEKIGQLSDIASQVPDFKFAINGQRAQSWLLNTFLDADLRISRGDGGSVFVLVKGFDE